MTKTKTTAAATPSVTIADVLARRTDREAAMDAERKLYAATMQTLGESDDNDSDECHAARDLAKLHGFDYAADLLFLRQRRLFLDSVDNDPDAASSALWAERGRVHAEHDRLVAELFQKKNEAAEQSMLLNTRAMLIVNRAGQFVEETKQRSHLFTTSKG